jgi:uncharacterized metal-binding protein
MAKGKTHDFFNLLMGTFFSILLVWRGISWENLGFFLLGFLTATWVLSIMPKKRSGVLLRFILFPYSILFKHRGLSHSFLFGSLTRVLYLILVGNLMFYSFSRFGWINYDETDYWDSLTHFLSGFDSEQWQYQALIWVFIGLVLSDFFHLLVDVFFSKLKRFTRF